MSPLTFKTLSLLAGGEFRSGQDLAAALGVSRQTLHELMSCKRAVTPDLAGTYAQRSFETMQRLGMKTVWVTREPRTPAYVDVKTASVLALPRLLGRLDA